MRSPQPSRPSRARPRALARFTLGAFLFGTAIWACSPSEESEAPLFREGCPEVGRARAAKITHPELRMDGPDALGGAGDYLLMNDRAAFVIQGTEKISTYYYYGGILVDAVALEGCAQAGLERFEEAGFLIAQANLGAFEQSIVRAFRGDAVEIVSDGRDGGEARLRVTGSDAHFWLIELELMKKSFLGGAKKPMSSPFGVEVTVDYVLPPDSPVLRIELEIRNTSGTPKSFQTLGAVSFGDSSDVSYYSQTGLGFGGFNVRMGVPWLAAESSEGSWAFAMDGAYMGTANVSGVDALVDIQQFLDPKLLEPAGGDDRLRVTYFVSVGGADENSAVRNLRPVNREPIPDLSYGLQKFEGRAFELGNGAGLAGAKIGVEMQDTDGVWHRLDGFRTRDGGEFGGLIPNFGEPLRLVAKREGHAEPEPQTFRADETARLEVGFQPSARLEYHVRDAAGADLPAKIVLWQDGRPAHRIYAAPGPGARELPQGRYEVTVSRGFEYSVYAGSLELSAGETRTLAVALEHVVDTIGFLSVDGHMHAGPSSDSRLSHAHRLLTAAAEGLEVAVATDHEIIRGWNDALAASGVQGYIAPVIGQEVTATLPEHTNIYPVVPRPDVPRGDPVRWYGLDLAEIFAAERARGAGIVTLNHPRGGCNYLCVIRYDRLTGLPTITDPTALGLKPDATLWSWNFDAVEYLNGHQDPFLDPARPDETGLFEDWMSFLNLGHRVTAMGVTDSHDDDAGSPRSYFAARTDAPAEFQEADLVRSVKEGRVLVSTGAFARVRVGEAGMGDTVRAMGGQIQLGLRLEALPEIDVTRILIFVNCDAVDEIRPEAPYARVKYDGVRAVPIERDAHVVVVALGRERLPRGLAEFDPNRVPRVTTNPIYVDADGDGRWTPPLGKRCAYDIDRSVP